MIKCGAFLARFAVYQDELEPVCGQLASIPEDAVGTWEPTRNNNSALDAGFLKVVMRSL